MASEFRTRGTDMLTAIEMSTEELLASQGDSRHLIGEDGRNRYGNRYRPEPGLLTFGSCTSSTISPEAFEAAGRLHGWLRALDTDLLPAAIDDLYERVRTMLLANLAMSRVSQVEVALTPSGTDAELIPLMVAAADGREVLNVVVGPTEAGSGTFAAASAMHFDSTAPRGDLVAAESPIDPGLARRVSAVRVSIRDDEGRPRDEASIDDEVSEIVRAAVAAGTTCLVHVIAHSKTGVHAPSLAAVERLRRLGGDRVEVVIDAAQGRFSRRGLGECLALGYMAIVTGSKFFGGPPFAGAVLLPDHPDGRPRRVPPLHDSFSQYLTAAMMPRNWTDVRASLIGPENIGLLVRWWAALAEINDFYSVPSALRFVVLQRIHETVPDLFASAARLSPDVVPTSVASDGSVRLLESKATVFPFTVSAPDGSLFSSDELRALQRSIRTPGRQPVCAELGQPVEVGSAHRPRAVLRLAFGAREIIRASVMSSTGKTFEQRIERLVGDARAVIDEIDAAAAIDRKERS